MNKIIFYHNVYIEQYSSVVGPIEAEGPLKDGFDLCVADLYNGCDNYEHAEISLLEDAYDCLLSKVKDKRFDICVGGDLMNQLGVSSYFVRQLQIPFIGCYAACSNSTLAINLASLYLNNQNNQRALVFTSSHYANAEKQFRFPNEYGIQKKDTVTSTVTGAGCISLCNEKQTIQIVCGMFGEVYDALETDANDMGSAMVMACYRTIVQFFADGAILYQDVDHIFTGDLSSIGKALLIQMLEVDYQDIASKLDDCGTIIYDIDNQKVFAGGSGCACSMCTLNAYILPGMLDGKYQRVLVVATGALLNPIMIQQKESIPCIAHAILLEKCI